MSDRKGAAVGSISSLLAGGFSGWAISKVCDEAFPALTTPLADHPLETVALSSMASLIGFGIGWFARGRSQRMTRAERKYLKEREEKSKREGFEEAKRSFYQLDPELKALMLAALDKGGAYCNGGDWRFSRLPEEPFIAQFVETRYIDGDVAKITALPLLEEFRGLVPDAFDGVRKTLDRHARDRGSRVVASFSASSLNWWWYR